MPSTAAATTVSSLLSTSTGELLGIVAILALVLVLILREFGSAEIRAGRESPRLRFLMRTLNAPILSLMVVFAVVVAVRVWQVLLRS